MVPSVSGFQCYLFAIYTIMSKESESPMSSTKQYWLHHWLVLPYGNWSLHSTFVRKLYPLFSFSFSKSRLNPWQHILEEAFFLVAHFSLGGRWRDEWNDGKICCWSWLPGEFLRWIRSPSCLRNIFSGHFYQELCYWGISIKYKVSMDKFFHEFL